MQEMSSDFKFKSRRISSLNCAHRISGIWPVVHGKTVLWFSEPIPSEERERERERGGERERGRERDVNDTSCPTTILSCPATAYIEREIERVCG